MLIVQLINTLVNKAYLICILTSTVFVKISSYYFSWGLCEASFVCTDLFFCYQFFLPDNECNNKEWTPKLVEWCTCVRAAMFQVLSFMKCSGRHTKIEWNHFRCCSIFPLWRSLLQCSVSNLVTNLLIKYFESSCLVGLRTNFCPW